MKRVSLKDIACMAGVSTSTVSLVLNGKARKMRISDGLAKTVKAIAKKAGYQPNQVAVSLRTGKSKILGLVVESISGNFFGSLAKVIEEAAQEHDYRIVYCSTENDSNKGHDLIQMLSHRQVDGYLVTPTSGMEKDVKMLLDSKQPLVLIDSYFPSIPASHVTVDNAGGVKTGMQHLIDKGYKNIGFITVDLPLIQMIQRANGYHETLTANSIRFKAGFVLKLSYNGDRDESVNRIATFIKKNSKLDAIFVATNYLGIVALESLKVLGMKIPEDIAMICFDDHDIFRLYPPGLSVIQQPILEIGRTAVRLLVEQMENGDPIAAPVKIQLTPKFINRKST
ncbi:MAG: substrate-binding domain-containing protein [Chitinophagaceae bacterium]